MTTKEAFRQLRTIFSPPPPNSTTSPASFPDLSLPPETASLIDSHLSNFAASFPLGGGGGHQRESESERERTRWREGLLDLWVSLVEPRSGTERDPPVVARVSAFLVLLETLSARQGDDDDSALVPRKDIGNVWWKAVLRRTMLGSAHEESSVARDKSRGRRGAPIRKDAAASAEAAGTVARPLTVSRAALHGGMKMVAWGMAPTTAVAELRGPSLMTPFAAVVWDEYKERVVSMLKGHDEGYGVRNIEECIVGWGEKSPQVRPLAYLTAPLR